MDRTLVLRRVTQATVLLAFMGTARWGWSLAGMPLLRGDLSASQLLGVIPLADPFAMLQILATGHVPEARLFLGALLVLAFYAVVGGRSFCSWVCPVNILSDASGRLAASLPIRQVQKMSRHARTWFLGLALLLSGLLGIAAFEWISPIGMFHRGVIFGLGTAWMVLGGVFLFDLLLVKNGWCGHLCPLGAFYGLLGRVAQVRVRFFPDTCTHCGECAQVCPEPHVLNLKQAAVRGMVSSGDCTNCGRCVAVCPEDSLAFAWRRSCQGTAEVSPSNVR